MEFTCNIRVANPFIFRAFEIDWKSRNMNQIYFEKYSEINWIGEEACFDGTC